MRRVMGTHNIGFDTEFSNFLFFYYVAQSNQELWCVVVVCMCFLSGFTEGTNTGKAITIAHFHGNRTIKTETFQMMVIGSHKNSRSPSLRITDLRIRMNGLLPEVDQGTSQQETETQITGMVPSQ